jgi:hypothetical protein
LALGVADRPWSIYNRREHSAEAAAHRAQYDRQPLATHNITSGIPAHGQSYGGTAY